MTDFKSLGLDRLSTNIKKATSSFSRNPSVGDITRGEVVSVVFSSSSTGTAQVKGRRTGAIPISNTLDSNERWTWSISGTTLTVSLESTSNGTIEFYVF